MGRKPKYATEEERQAAKREQNRQSQAKHREEKGRPSRAGQGEPWQPAFIGIDGESFVTDELLPDGSPKQAYCLLLRNDQPPIFNPKGLSTWECLRYLTKDVPVKTALVGFFLNFDFEHILKDIKQTEYEQLQAGEEVTLFEGEFICQWFVGKKLVVYRLHPWGRRTPRDERIKRKHYRKVEFQDVQGFFQSSFVNALKKWGFEKDDRLQIITTGKAARGGFRLEDIEDVSAYNKAEMDLLEALMMKVYNAFKAAYEAAGLKFSVNAQKWSGPGVFANDFLKQTFFNEQHTPPKAEMVRKYRKDKESDFGNDHALDYPFSLAYYGGRIELAAAGKFGRGFNYDVNSAYPYALSLLPYWNEMDFQIYGYQGTAAEDAKPFLDRRLMGMYKVRFSFPPGWSWYPFPIRDFSGGTPNVFYPRSGVTHVMSAELFAVLDTLPAEELSKITILDAFVLEETDGFGDALTRMPYDRLSVTARMTLKMAEVRLDCKDAAKRINTLEEMSGDQLLSEAEKGLKLILNSLYGKTVQQIGSHKYYNDFAAAWITSVCRGLLWRAIAPERKTENVLMTMTDGLYSLTPLPFAADRLTSILGDWEAEPFETIETFKPGVYRYAHKDKKGNLETVYRVRGFLTPTIEDKEKLFSLINDAQTTGSVPKFPAKQFLTRNISKDGWQRSPWRNQFYTDEKDIKAELKAKRDPVGNKWTFEPGKENGYFPPKRSTGFHMNHSKGYSLNFEGIRLPEDEEDTEEFLLDYDSRVGLEEYFE